MIDWQRNLPEGHPIGFNLGVYEKGTGKIRGVASFQPGVVLYIVEIETLNGRMEDYPYSCITVPASNLYYLE